MSLYAQYFYSAQADELLSDKHLIAQMLRFEGTLALAQAEQGLMPQASAEAIANCCQTDLIDTESLIAAVRLGGNAAIPLIKQLTQAVKQKYPEAAGWVHLGATSQDVIDTATVLQIEEFIYWLDEKLAVLSELLMSLSRRHRQTLMVGRTLLQQAKPITFGLKTAYWLAGIERTRERIAAIESKILTLQLGGAVGSGNTFISAAVQQNLADKLNLNAGFAWHTQRDNLAEWAAVLGILGGSLGKIAKDIALLMQTEIAEVLEGAAEGKGGSSTMPHKQNPVLCTAILANANRLPPLVSTMLAAMPQEHERSAGLWHSEWEVLTEIMRLVAGSVERSTELLEGLEVAPQQMLSNLERTNGLIYAENVSLALAPKLGKAQAHELLEQAVKRAVSEQKHLKTVLTDMALDLPDLDELFSPEKSIGDSLLIIDEILAGIEPDKYQKT